MLPLLSGLFLVGCGASAADGPCEELRQLEARIVDVDAEDEHATDVLSETYEDVSALAERTGGEIGDALTDIQPLVEKLGALTGDDEAAAVDAQEQLAELSEAEVDAIDEAADFLNATCDLSVLL